LAVATAATAVTGVAAVQEGRVAVLGEGLLAAVVRAARVERAAVVREAVVWVRVAREVAAMVTVVEMATVVATPAAVARVKAETATVAAARRAAASVHTHRNRPCDDRLFRWPSQCVCSDTRRCGRQTARDNSCSRLEHR
jgi:hypothetical protein